MNNNAEAQLSHAIRLRLGRDTRCVLFRNTVGVVTDGRRTITYGLGKGSADLVGMVNGRFFALEVKSPTGVVSKEQMQWIAMIRYNKGFATIVRSIEDAVRAVDDACDWTRNGDDRHET